MLQIRPSATTDKTECADHVSGVPKTVVAAAIGILIGILETLLAQGFGNGLDPGWQEVLNWGITHNAQWGHQLIFTYGPLGFIAPGQPIAPSMFWVQLSLQMAFAAIVAWLAAANLRRMPWPAVLSFAVAVIVFGRSWSNSSTLLIVFPLAILILERTSRATDAPGLRTHLIVAGLAAFTALQSFIKFSSFPLWLAWLVLGALIIWRADRRSLLATYVLTSVIVPIVAWTACSQHIVDLPAFFAMSWKVAKYYVVAMQRDPPTRFIDYGSITAVSIELVCIFLFAWQQCHSVRRLAVYAMFVTWLALSYRAGTLRSAQWHLAILLSTLAWCAPLLIGTNLEYRATARTSLFTAISTIVFSLLALAPVQMMSVYDHSTPKDFYTGRYTINEVRRVAPALLDLPALRAYGLSVWAADRKKLALPKIDKRVGNDSIDALMNSQSSLLANNLNYDPRPVFQGYAAYSGHLARLNADFLLSSRAPRWLMWNGYAIGGRYPTSDDAQALVRVLQNYEPDLIEGGFLLLKRRSSIVTAPIASVTPARVFPIGFRSATRISASTGNAWYARINVKLTAYGKLQSLLFRPPTLKINATFEDGSQHLYKLVRSVAHSGFMLSPALSSNSQYLLWLQGDNSRNVTSIRLLQTRVFNHNAFRVKGALRLYALRLPHNPIFDNH